MHNSAEFEHQVQESILDAKEHLHDTNQFSSDIHYLKFSSYNPNIHGTYRKMLLANTENGTYKNKSMTWVKPGSLEPFSSHSMKSYDC